VILPVLRRFKSPATQTETQHDILIWQVWEWIQSLLNDKF
jgi:hypothetical protein